MTVFKITKTIAKCNYEGCVFFDEIATAHMPDAIATLKNKGWWIRRLECFCPEHGRPFLEANLQRKRDSIMAKKSLAL